MSFDTFAARGKDSTAKVDFVVSGAQKSGTRALRKFLLAHPEIGLSRPDIPENHYFDREMYKDKSAEYVGYHQMYIAEDLNKTTGDITPIYLYQRGCFEHIRSYNPDMKIIVLLRDPVARAYSQWAMEHERGSEHRSFGKALLHELYYWSRHGQHPVYSYLQRGFYGVQVARLFSVFPQERCLILLNEALRTDHAGTLARIYSFLEVEQRLPPSPEVVHSRNYNPLSYVMRRGLYEIYRRDIRKLERLTGLDCSGWRK